jgi:hypothetical protein
LVWAIDSDRHKCYSDYIAEQVVLSVTLGLG